MYVLNSSIQEQPDATVDPILSSANYLPIGMITSLKQWQSITLQAPGMAEEIGRIVEAESLRAETIHNGKMRLAMKTWIQCQIKKQQAVSHLVAKFSMRYLLMLLNVHLQLLCQLLEASDILESNHLF